MKKSFAIAALALVSGFGLGAATTFSVKASSPSKGTIGIVCQSEDAGLLRYSRQDRSSVQMLFRTCVRDAMKEWAPVIIEETTGRRPRYERGASLEAQFPIQDNIEAFKIVQESLRQELYQQLNTTRTNSNLPAE